eukprot:568318-Alexandrium_andersonii.AAC.1
MTAVECKIALGLRSLHCADPEKTFTISPRSSRSVRSARFFLPIPMAAAKQAGGRAGGASP